MKKSKILIVDDEPLNVKLFAAALSSEGYQIVKAFNGEQALVKVNEESPDLIILDIMMPDIDGFEITRKIKKATETRDIPIILITASDDSNYKAIGLEAGADEFLNKPIKPIELKARTKSLLKTKEYRDKLVLKQQARNTKRKNCTPNSLNDKIKNSLVLLWDENSNDSELIKTYLHGQPYNLDFAKSKKEAIEICNQKKNVDLILIDANIKQALDFCGQLKVSGPTANIQTLVILNSDNLEKKSEKVEFWPDDFLIKPINIHELRLRICALLKKKIYLDELYAGLDGRVPSEITDSLSGLANYSFFKYFLENEIKRSIRTREAIALIMIEICDCNHTHNALGHPAGEKLLNKVGTLIKENIRDTGLGARCKERRFAIVLPDTDRDEAETILRQIRGLIKNRLSMVNKDLSNDGILQFGIAIYPSDADSTEMLINHTERKLLSSNEKQFI